MVRCEECDKDFGTEESLEHHNRAKHSEKFEKPKGSLSDAQKKKIRNWGIFVVVFVLVGWGIFYLATNVKTLPPVSMQGHIEVNPPSHVMRVPMKLEIHKHMLEHADGGGPSGIIINYNCDDYECEEGLIENLEAFAERYPSNVYVAPFQNMDAKIALTKLNKIQILEQYDEKVIDNFINNRR